MSNELILVVNSGSSSLKFGLCRKVNDQEQLVLEGLADGIGGGHGELLLKDDRGQVVRSEGLSFASQGDALATAARWLDELQAKPQAIGHRVVHGGPLLTSHQPITSEVLAQLRACLHFAPVHIPIGLELIERVERIYPEAPQFACFDTAFHRSLPEVAARFALPSDLFDEGIRRYGFHGLSYESIVHQWNGNVPSRMIIAHLGNGASVVAVKDGLSVDTTMGLTPTGGIPMATRSGDLDPGVILYLLQAKQLSARSIETLLNKTSGLTALSQGKRDMRELQAAADAGDRHARLALDVFCTSIRKTIGAYTAVLGGLDAIVFTGGIGEHSPQVRRKVCNGLEFLGARIDEQANLRNDKRISAVEARLGVFVFQSQEELQIARHCRPILKRSA